MPKQYLSFSIVLEGKNNYFVNFSFQASMSFYRSLRQDVVVTAAKTLIAEMKEFEILSFSLIAVFLLNVSLRWVFIFFTISTF